jgi:hypothetical protein
MKIEFLYSADCPNAEPAMEVLQEVLKKNGVKTTVQRINVQTGDEARRHRFPGSPTIRIDGRDVAGNVDTDYGLRCRIYGLEGTNQYWPPREWIEEAIGQSRR